MSSRDGQRYSCAEKYKKRKRLERVLLIVRNLKVILKKQILNFNIDAIHGDGEDIIEDL
jgi:hypothetical protein